MPADTQLPVLPLAIVAPGPAPPERARLVRRARALAQIGLGWHLVEAAVAIAAGVVAGSVALVGFGADSLIEAAAGVVVLWLMAGGRSSSPSAERRAQQLIAASFLVLAVYIGVESVRDLVGGHRPDASWVGIGLSVVTLATMPPLAAAKRRVGEQLGSSATMSESRQTMVCAYLSAALLVACWPTRRSGGGGPIRSWRSGSPPSRCARGDRRGAARRAGAARSCGPRDGMGRP
jgi:divalent metal cation (Fe/Co/Zn/Cd) transporter